MLTKPLVAAIPPSAAPLQPGDLLDENEAAAILGAQVQTLRNWRWKGIGPRAIRIGQRMIRYRRDDLLAFIEAGSERAA